MCIIFHMRNLRSHDASGLNLNRILDWNRIGEFFDLTDPMLDIRSLKTCIRSCKCRIDLFLNILRLIDQIHQFTDQNISFFIHQIIALFRQRKRVLGCDQISFGREFSWVHNLTTFLAFLLFRQVFIDDLRVDSV